MLESNKYKIKNVENLKKELKKRSNIVERNRRLALKVSDWLSGETGKPVNPDEPGGGEEDADNWSPAIQPTISLILLSILVSIYR